MSVNKEVIDRIRTAFVAMAKESPEDYHSLDVQRVAQKDWWVERFVLITKSEDSALKALVKAMLWRKTFGVNDFTDQTFPEEMYRVSEYVHFCRDREGRPVLWSQMARHHRCGEWNLQLKQFVVYQFERLDRDAEHEGWAFVGDPTGAGLSNVEMDFSNFTTEVLQNYYPKGAKYMAVVDLPWILKATATLIMSFMNEHLKSVVKFIGRDQLTDYLAPESIPVHLKGTYDKPLSVVPPGVTPLDQHSDYTADQIKKIYSAYKSELK